MALFKRSEKKGSRAEIVVSIIGKKRRQDVEDKKAPLPERGCGLMGKK